MVLAILLSALALGSTARSQPARETMPGKPQQLPERGVPARPGRPPGAPDHFGRPVQIAPNPHGAHGTGESATAAVAGGGNDKGRRAEARAGE